MSPFVFQCAPALALVLIAATLIWILAHARRQRLLLIEAMGGGHPTHRRLRDVLRVIAFVLLVVALARPGYSPQAEMTSRSGRDVVFAIDVSQSMLAEDAIPSRLEVAKQGVRDALYTFGNERVGLIVYGGSASILCPLTYDYDFVRYMLEQANPRTVDFGGTTVQSAIEKAVDQVFIEGREGVQDLIVLTDGGDHGSVIAKATKLLDEKEIDTLLIGIGNPHQGSPIKIKDGEGNTKLFEYEGSPVYTKLDDTALREFARLSERVDYLPVGTGPFNLGQIYIEYAKDKQVTTSDSESGIVVYEEAAIFFLIPAVILLLLSERWGSRGLELTNLGIALLTLYLLPSNGTAAGDFKSDFALAVELINSGALEEADTLLEALQKNTSADQASPEQLAAVHFNHGLAIVGLADKQLDPRLSLNYLYQAQQAFLAAKRSAPDLRRAGIRIELISARILELHKQLEQIEAEDDWLKNQLEVLVGRLQKLLQAQSELRELVEAAIQKPETAKPLENKQSKQSELADDAKDIERLMKEIDAAIAIDIEGMANEATIMTLPLSLIALAENAQRSAADYLTQIDNLSLGKELQFEAEQHIEAILSLLTNSSQQQSSEPDDYEESGDDYDYMDEMMEGISDSDAMQGDFAAGAEMQELPAPNYSAEDILLEEQGNQQFREQKRASANAGKVEKDF